MNESTLTQLKIIVERAVRPVRAGTARKRKMREELLAHVSAVFEEEAQRGDTCAAVARVAARFGTPAELTRQLQESVPLHDRIPWFVENLVGFPARESAVRRAARCAGLVGGTSAVGVGIMLLAHSNRSHWLTPVGAPSLFAAVAVAFLVFWGTLLAAALREALYGPRGRSWLLTGLVVAAASCYIPATTFAYCVALTRDIGESLGEVLPIAPIGVLLPVGLALFVYCSEPEIRYHEEWASLPIGDGTGVAFFTDTKVG
jgi:hypothetical protein